MDNPPVPITVTTSSTATTAVSNSTAINTGTDRSSFSGNLFLTEEQMKRTQQSDKHLMKLIPILWEGPVRKKGEWLPRWEELYMTIDGISIRLYESKNEYLAIQALEERAMAVKPKLFPLNSPPLSAGASKSKSRGSRTASLPARAPVSQPTAASISSGEKEKKPPAYTVTSIAKENVGRAHGFMIKTQEKKPMHFAVDTEIERVVWLHLVSAAIDQVAIDLPAAKKKFPSISQLPPPAPSLRVHVPGILVKTLLGTPIAVNLYMFYEAWGHIQCRKGNFADLVPSLHPNITITSNLPPSVPISGEYHGREGLLAFFTKMHSTIDISHYMVQNMARRDDLAVVTGRETIKNVSNGRKFRHLWKHELRFEADGRISHINIIADKTAAAVAFGIQSDGPSLALPHEQEQSATKCPPGEIRVVCISGESVKRRKALPASANMKVTIGLNNFPHLNLKTNSGSSSTRSLNSSNASSHVGTWKSYSTRLSKNGNGSNPLWVETLSIQFSGAVPGTSTCLFIEVWSVSVMGDELVGCTKVNLANHLGTSTSNKEELASSAVPKWYDLRRPEYFTTGSGGSTGSTSGFSSDKTQKNRTKNDASAVDDSVCGRLQLSICFLPYGEDVDDDTSFAEGENDDQENENRQTLQHRRSFDLLQALHEETGEKQRNSEFGSLHSTRLDDGTAGYRASVDEESRTSGLERSSIEGGGSPDDMYTFTVASTKFRVYTRYQLIRAIGHGAYGVVIAASDQITGNSVAIKNIPKTFDDLVDAKRIVREIRLMRHLHHPNIVSVVDVMRPPSLEAFEDTYIVTDLMETDLHRVINSQETLSSDHIAYITYQMLCAIRYIHSAQIIHRDIKPSNILINRDCLVKICDFGLARGIDVTDDGELIEQALTEYVVTRWYRAPELLLASKYTTSIDLWSIGCILVEMFTRKALFPGHDHVHQLHLILQLVGSPSQDEMGFITNTKARRWISRQAIHEPKSFTAICPSAPADAIDLITRLLHFDPRKRITVDDAIKHPFLAAYRRENEWELVADAPFDFSFEKETRRKLDKDALRCLIFEDVCHFHPEAKEELEQFVAEQELLRQVEEQEKYVKV